MGEPLYGPVFQTAYIVADLSSAIEAFSRRFGVSKFLRSPGPVTLTPHGAEPMQVELALAFIGETMLELIRPAGGSDDIYRPYLPDSPSAMRFHHVAFRLWDQQQWSDMLAHVEHGSHRVAMRGEQNNTRYLYLDTRAELGHYTEYLYYLDPERSSLPRIPQNRE